MGVVEFNDYAKTAGRAPRSGVGCHATRDSEALCLPCDLAAIGYAMMPGTSSPWTSVKR